MIDTTGRGHTHRSLYKDSLVTRENWRASLYSSTSQLYHQSSVRHRHCILYIPTRGFIRRVPVFHILLNNSRLHHTGTSQTWYQLSHYHYAKCQRFSAYCLIGTWHYITLLLQSKARIITASPLHCILDLDYSMRILALPSCISHSDLVACTLPPLRSPLGVASPRNKEPFL